MKFKEIAVIMMFNVAALWFVLQLMIDNPPL